MTAAEYDAERAKLADQRKHAGARFDQELAKLFLHSGWTQDELAKREGKGQTWVNYNLRFGSFLRFITTVINPESLPSNLTERRFRGYWEQTEKESGNERQRFIAVQKLIAEELSLQAKRRPHIGQDIKEHFADGKWHKPGTIAEKLGRDEDHVIATLEQIIKRKAYGLKCEQKQVGKHTEYRIFPNKQTIGSQELITKLGPIIDGLKAEGKKNMATMSPNTVAYLAGKLQQIVDQWTK
jgi:hypothetical protein